MGRPIALRGVESEASVGVGVRRDEIVEAAKLRLTFRHKTKEELNAWLASGTDVKSDAEWLGVIVAGWEGVNADFSPEALALLVSNYHQPAVEAIVAKFLSELTEVRRGN